MAGQAHKWRVKHKVGRSIWLAQRGSCDSISKMTHSNSIFALSSYIWRPAACLHLYHTEVCNSKQLPISPLQCLQVIKESTGFFRVLTAREKTGILGTYYSRANVWGTNEIDQSELERNVGGTELITNIAVWDPLWILPPFTLIGYLIRKANGYIYIQEMVQAHKCGSLERQSDGWKCLIVENGFRWYFHGMQAAKRMEETSKLWAMRRNQSCELAM